MWQKEILNSALVNISLNRCRLAGKVWEMERMQDDKSKITDKGSLATWCQNILPILSGRHLIAIRKRKEIRDGRAFQVLSLC